MKNEPKENVVEQKTSRTIDRRTLLERGAIMAGGLVASQLLATGKALASPTAPQESKPSASETFTVAVAGESMVYRPFSKIQDPTFLALVKRLREADVAYTHLETNLAAAVRALEIDPNSAEAHVNLGIIALCYEWDWVRGEKELRRAIQLNPFNSMAHAWYAADLAAAGKLDQSLREAQRAEALDPVSPQAAVKVGQIYYWSRQYDRAAASFRRAIDLAPQYSVAYLRLGTVHIAQKKYPEAIRELTQAKSMFHGDCEIDALIAYAEAASGDRTSAKRLLDDLQHNPLRQYVSAYSITLVYTALGEHAEALHWLEQCRKQKPASLVYAQIEPLFDPLRSDPHFLVALNKAGITSERTVATADSYNVRVGE